MERAISREEWAGASCVSGLTVRVEGAQSLIVRGSFMRRCAPGPLVYFHILSQPGQVVSSQMVSGTGGPVWNFEHTFNEPIAGDLEFCV